MTTFLAHSRWADANGWQAGHILPTLSCRPCQEPKRSRLLTAAPHSDPRIAGAVVQATPRPARQSCTGITAELDTLEYDVLPVRPRVQALSPWSSRLVLDRVSRPRASCSQPSGTHATPCQKARVGLELTFHSEHDLVHNAEYESYSWIGIREWRCTEHIIMRLDYLIRRCLEFKPWRRSSLVSSWPHRADSCHRGRRNQDEAKA
jgi:hypothetical protein